MTLPALHISGRDLLDSAGARVVLRGVNTEGIANVMAYFPGGVAAYLSRMVGVDADGKTWLTRAVRLNFERYPCCNPSRLYQAGDPRIPDCIPDDPAAWTAWQTNVLDPAVQKCVDLGLYAIICDCDFGPADLPLRTTRMMGFWGQLSKSKWANHPNVLFDLWNESEDVGTYKGWTWTNQKPAIQACVDMIRANGANNIVVVTTPAYCAYTDLATSDPLTGSNLAYAAHHYSDYYTANAPHLATALASGQAVIVSEFGSNKWTDPVVTSAFMSALKAQIEGPTPAAGWMAWDFSATWAPDLWADAAMTIPTVFGVAVRDWLTEGAAVPIVPVIVAVALATPLDDAKAAVAAAQTATASAQASLTQAAAALALLTPPPPPPPPPPPTGGPALVKGVWTDLTPPGLNLLTPTTPPHYGIAAFAIDPSNPYTLYVCVDQQGMWKTTNGGSAWARIGNLDSPIAVSVDPTNPLHLVATQGVRGNTLGFWVSQDGGSTWAIPASFTATNTTSDVTTLAIDPADWNHMLVGSHGPWPGAFTEGFLETKDAGVTWIAHAPRAEWGVGSLGLNILKGGAWLVGTDGNGTWRSTDSGATWTKVSAFSISHGGHQIYVASNGYLYAGAAYYPIRSKDDGLTWEQLTALPYAYWYSVYGDGVDLFTQLSFTGDNGGHGPQPYYTSKETDGLAWAPYNPNGTGAQTFADGPFMMLYDSSHQILYSANWNTGFWALKP